MKLHRIITLYFFQKICYHGNHITHSVAPPKSKAIASVRKQVGEIFSNSYITCYQKWCSKYVSLKKICRAGGRKKLLYHYCFLIFFPTYRIFKKLVVDTHPIDWKKFTHRKRKYWPMKLEIWKKSRSTRSHFTHVRSCSRVQSSSHACETTGVPSQQYSLWKRDIFPFDRFKG